MSLANNIEKVGGSRRLEGSREKSKGARSSPKQKKGELRSTLVILYPQTMGKKKRGSRRNSKEGLVTKQNKKEVLYQRKNRRWQ